MRFNIAFFITTLFTMELAEEGELALIIIKNKRGQKERFVKVICEICKVERLQRIDKYLKRKTNNCISCNGRVNCPHKSIHDLSTTQIYRKYQNILRRCYDPNDKGFKYYGGRGIGVSMEWLDPKEGLKRFCEWSFNNGWKEDSKLQIDRIDNDGDYEPENCQFITQIENLGKMDNLFGIKGRKVEVPPKKNLDKFIVKFC